MKDNKQRRYVSVSYIQGASEIIQKCHKLNKMSKKCFSKLSLKIDTIHKADVVYKINW